MNLEDSDGNEYLDATGGSWCAQVGHARAELAEAASRQIEELEFFASFWDFSNEPSVRLARRLVELAPNNIEASTSRSEVRSRTRSRRCWRACTTIATASPTAS